MGGWVYLFFYPGGKRDNHTQTKMNAFDWSLHSLSLVPWVRHLWWLEGNPDRLFCSSLFVMDLLRMKVALTAVYLSEVFQFPPRSSWVALAALLGNHLVIYYPKHHPQLPSLAYGKCTTHCAWRCRILLGTLGFAHMKHALAALMWN